MNYFKRSAEILELEKILERLSEFSCCEDTKKSILRLHPCTNLEMVITKINETDEALSMLERSEILNLSEVKTPVRSLKLARAGSSLNPAALLNIGLILQQTRLILNFYKNNENIINSLKPYFLKLVEIKILEDQILKSIISEEVIADDASENLRVIRRSIVAKNKKIKDILNNIIKSPDKKYLQDNIISMKNGRYVLAVKSQFANKIAGLVQDVSSSQSTVFVEPAAVVECCNELKILFADEKAEIELILKNLTLNCLEYINEIEQNYFTILDFDFIFAKAKLALEMDARKPEIVNDGTINLVQARHPLIDKNKVVPIDVRLGGVYKNLIISGPNTGGKTVALKTIGLLSLMIMCGLLIPCLETSKISIFGKVLVSIGDEQSIENSLSTFSAHIQNLVLILKAVSAKTLVLIDEICSGTDPEQGAALAIAIVEKLCSKKACFVVTTHYTQLKFFALKNKFIENASFEFDETRLTPTYKLSIGSFGQSSAFQISKKIGMTDKIIDRAKQLLSTQRLKFDNVVDQLNKFKLKYEHSLKVQESKLKQLDELKLKFDKEKQKFYNSAQTYLDRAKQEATNTVNSVRAQANSILNELKEIKKIESAANLKEALERAKSISKNSVGRLLNKFNFTVEKTNDEYELPRKLMIGDEVLIYDIDKKGLVVGETDKQNKVLIEIGSMKTRIEVKRLRLVKGVEETKKVNLSIKKSVIGNKTRKVETSIDLRGQAAVDAIFMLDRAIDNCVLSNVGVLTIIHGKGTGVLRKAVFKHLKSHKNVQSQRLGDFYEGGDGVTIAELK